MSLQLPLQLPLGATTRVSRLALRLALAMLVGLLGVRPAAAEASSSSSPELDAMVRRIAASTANVPQASCAPNSSRPAPAFAAAGANAALGGGPGGLWVQCSLPYTNGAAGADCEGKHEVNWKVINGSPSAKVTAELLAFDANNNLLNTFLVAKGDQVHLNSRLNQGAWKFKAKDKGKKGDYFEVFAPLAMLKVTVEDQGDKVEAYCTAVPFTDVIEPSGSVVNESNGTSSIAFKAAVPRTDPTKLQLQFDGVDLLPLINANEVGGLGACTYLTPCEGTLPGIDVTYKNLIIDVAPNIATPASNTISGSLENLECGGHFVRVTTAADPAWRRKTPQCLLDDLTDKGSASVFSIELTELGGKTGNDLVPGMTTTQTPTAVKGLICSGTDILSANVNGKTLDVSSQVKVPGDGETIGDKVTYQINTTLNQTDLKADFEGTTTELGTFAPGSNRLLIAATEKSKGTRVYERLMFGVGSNLKPVGLSSSVMFKTSVLESQVGAGVQQALEAKMQGVLNLAGETTINNAFIVGLSADGAQTILNNLCNAPLDGDSRNLRDIFADAVKTELGKWTSSNPLTTFPFEPPCSCNTTVPVYIANVDTDVVIGDAFSCPITFEDHQMKVGLKLPDVTVKVTAYKQEECFANHTYVDAWIQAKLENIEFKYTLTEADIKGETTTVGPNPFTVGGKVQLDAFSDIDYGVAGDICDFFVEGFVTLLTFGTVDIGPLLEPDFSISEVINLTELMKPAKPNAIPIKGFNIDQQVNNQFHQEMKGEISNVSDIHITAPTGPGNTGAGITVGLKGTFATTSIDPLVEGNPGFQAKEPPLPTMASMQGQGAKDALVGLSQDSINMMFASLGANGDMAVPGSDAQGCFPLGATVGSLLPPNCEAIDITPATNTDDVANAAARGYCHAIKGANCATLAFQGNADPNLTAGEQGVCYGASGATCSTAANGNLVVYAACVATPNFNLHADQNLMFCAKADIPRMELPTAGSSTTSVPTNLQINDISVSLVLDRGTNNIPNNMVDGALADLPGCFSGTQTNADCNIFSACLDVNMKFTMNSLQPGNSVCEGGKPGVQAQFDQLLPVFRKIGEVCGGSTSPTTDQDVLDQASNQTTVTEPIAQNAAFFAPPICGAGLSVPNLFTCDQVAVLGLEAGIDPDFKEFLALTCDIH